jgi:hypothetical protein
MKSLLKKEYVIFALSCVAFVVGSEKSTSDKINPTAVDTMIAHLAAKYCQESSCTTIGSDTQHGRRYYIPVIKGNQVSNQKPTARWFGRGSSGKGEGYAKL